MTIMASDYEVEERLQMSVNEKMGLAPYPVPVPFFRFANDAIERIVFWIIGLEP